MNEPQFKLGEYVRVSEECSHVLSRGRVFRIGRITLGEPGVPGYPSYWPDKVTSLGYQEFTLDFITVELLDG